MSSLIVPLLETGWWVLLYRQIGLIVFLAHVHAHTTLTLWILIADELRRHTLLLCPFYLRQYDERSRDCQSCCCCFINCYGPGVTLLLLHEEPGYLYLPRVKLATECTHRCASMSQREWHGIDGTVGLGHWTHDPDGSLPLAQLELPIPLASLWRATSIHTFINWSYAIFLLILSPSIRRKVKELSELL